MKTILLLLFLIISFGSILSLPVTKEKLIKSNWNGSNNLAWTNEISFKDKTFTWDTRQPESPLYSYLGSYDIENNILFITIAEIQMEQGEIEKAENPFTLLCKLETAENSLLYSEKLDCKSETDNYENVEFLNTSIKLKQGSKRKVGQIPVTIFQKIMKTTGSSLTVRSSPSINSTPVNWHEEDKIEYSRLRKYLNKGEKVKVLARTSKKKKVGKSKNFWYYVQIPAIDPNKPFYIEINGWVFGDYLK